MAGKPPPPPAPPRATPPLKKPQLAPPQVKKPQLAPPPQVVPLKPPPSQHRPVHFRQQQGAAPLRKRRYRHHRAGGCSGRRVCCLAFGGLLLVLCLALAGACLAYLYYHPRTPAFHLQPMSPTRFRVGNASAVSAIDVAVAVRVVSWNPNDKIAFEYGSGEGRVSVADDDGDIALGWAPVNGFEHGARSVATVGFVAAVKGVVVDDAVAARVRGRYRRRQLGFKVVVDTRVGVRAGAVRTGKVPVRVLCDGGTMAPRAGAAVSTAGPMTKCQVYLLRLRWFNLS